MINNRQKSLLHVAKARIGMTEDEYRAMLSGFGVASSRELTGLQFDRVMAHMEKMGFEPRIKRRSYPASSKELLAAKVSRMAGEMRLTKTYIDAMARHMFHVDAWAWLDSAQLVKLVAALNYHRKRKGLPETKP